MEASRAPAPISTSSSTPTPTPDPARGPGARAVLALRSAQMLNEVRRALPGCGVRSAGAARLLDVAAAPSVSGRAPLVWNDRLAAVAERYAARMAREGFFDHVDPQGHSIGWRATAGGYRWHVVGENLAAGQAQLQRALQQWIASPAHCRNLIDPRFTEFGLARAESRDPDDVFGTYWVLVLALPG